MACKSWHVSFRAMDRSEMLLLLHVQLEKPHVFKMSSKTKHCSFDNETNGGNNRFTIIANGIPCNYFHPRAFVVSCAWMNVIVSATEVLPVSRLLVQFKVLVFILRSDQIIDNRQKSLKFLSFFFKTFTDEKTLEFCQNISRKSNEQGRLSDRI